MNKNIEKEYKHLLNESSFNFLLSKMNKPNFIMQENIYYDTVTNFMSNNKITCRIRTINETHLFTLKQWVKSELVEYEVTVKSNDVSAFSNIEIVTLFNTLSIPIDIIPIASLTTRRALIPTDNAEICFDINYYNGKVDYEIEYEYLYKHDGLKCFQDILDLVNEKYESNCPSKISRAINSK